MSLESLTTTNLITIVGWGVAFGLGLLSALIIQKRGKTRKIITWSVVSESNLLARDALERLESGFGVPVRVVIDGHDESALSTIRVRIASASNIEIQGLSLYFSFGSAATVYVGRYVGDLGAYRQKLKLIKSDNVAELTVAHINPGRSFDVEFLVARYESGELTVDMAEPGVTLRLTKVTTLDPPELRITRLQLTYYVIVAIFLILVGALMPFMIDRVFGNTIRSELQRLGTPPNVTR